MANNEKGMIFLPFLFFISLIMLYLIGSIPSFSTSKQILHNEWGKFQAERNADAGVYLALEDWIQDSDRYNGTTYVLSKGIVQVTVRKQSDTVLEIMAVGSYQSLYKEKIKALFDTENRQWIEWIRL